MIILQLFYKIMKLYSKLYKIDITICIDFTVIEILDGMKVVHFYSYTKFCWSDARIVDK